MVYNRRQISSLYWPILLDLISAAAMGFLDSMMVSSCGDAAVAGVSLINQLSTVYMAIASAFAAGGGAIVAQYFGHGEKDRSCETAKQLVYLMLAASAVLVALCELLRVPLIKLFFGKSDPEVLVNASSYYIWIFISFVPYSVFQACSNSFRAFGRSSGYLTAALVANVMNVAGNAFFIYVMKWGVAGAAISTVIARIALAVIVLVSITSKKHEMRVRNLFRFKPDLSIAKTVNRLAVPQMIESGLQQFGKTILYGMMSALPTAQVAAYAVAGNMGVWLEYIPAAMSNTMISVVGKCCGAGEKEEADRHGKFALLNAHVSTLPIAVLFIAFAKPLTGLFGISPESLDLAVAMIRVYAVACLLLYPETWTISSMLRPAGDVKFTMVVTMTVMWFSRVFCGWLAINVFKLGIWGCWGALYLDWFIRCAFFIPRYFSGRWKRFDVI